MNQVTHDNHFVSQMYLKQWSSDGVRLCAYRVLVSREEVPKWTYRSISQVAYQRDLYTEIVNGEEADSFERWLESEFENPVQQSIRKVLKDSPLSALDWERLANFLGAQDVRTPLSYLESTERWKTTLPNILQSTLEETVRRFEQKTDLEERNGSFQDTSRLFDDILKIETLSSSDSESGQAQISAEIVAGRRLWIQSQRFLLTKTIEALRNHKWCIVRPARGFQWFTSDHPVVKLNYYGNNDYDLKGGWGRKGGNIFMPISPHHLLFTQIGDDLPDRLTLSSEQTRLFQRFIAERALRWIFAYEPMKIIEEFRPRQVNAATFEHEAEEWKIWHQMQTQAERSTKTPLNDE